MKEYYLSLSLGFLLAGAAMWLVAWINRIYTEREKRICRLILKRARKD